MAEIPSTKVSLNAFVDNLRQMFENGIEPPEPTCREEIFLPPGVSLEAYKEMRRSFVAKPSDVFVLSYPKSGTTWMQYIVSLIKNNGVDDGEDLDDKWLWMDIFTQEEVTRFSASKPGLYQTHLPYSLVPGLSKDSPAKYIYIYRNPKDTAVSFYYMIQSLVGPMPWDVYFDKYMKGEVPTGPVLDNHLECWEHKDDSNVLMMSYEQMKADLHSSIRTVATFLGHDIDDAMLNKIAEQCTFTAMKKTDAVNKSAIAAFNVEADFLRKGVVGDWKNHLTAEQSDKIEALVAEKTAGTGIVYDYGQ